MKITEAHKMEQITGADVGLGSSGKSGDNFGLGIISILVIIGLVLFGGFLAILVCSMSPLLAVIGIFSVIYFVVGVIKGLITGK